VYYKSILLIGFDKIRKNEMENYEKRFEEVDSIAKQHNGHKILVMHQGIAEINKFAGELNSTDLPKNFTYYAMGHLHDQFLKNFSYLSGPLAYPGSIELTTSEGIKDTKKGFYQVDVSSKEAKPSWIELDIRPQYSTKTTSSNLSKTIDDILYKNKLNSKKPIVELKIEAENVSSEEIQAQISRLIPHTLYYSWKIFQKQEDGASVLMDRPVKIDEELFKLAINSLKSEQLANFAVKELLPLLSTNQIEQANQLVIENFEKFRKEKLK
jgi:DNA repair exonuclease SbcCD nuclease subunit